MKIAHIHFWYSQGFGYTENMLPKALAKLGHDVHLITSNTQIYWHEPMYKEVYEPILGNGITACGNFEENGVKIYRLPHFTHCPFKKKIHHFENNGIKNIYQTLERLKPDVIQTQGIYLYSTYYAAKYAKRNGIKLFTENHIHKSVFNRKNQKFWSFYNYFNPLLKTINSNTTKCFPIAPDAEELTREFYKVPRSKIKLQSLGVDTDSFKYMDRMKRSQEIKDLRRKLGYEENDIVVIYTGRFTSAKNPLCLAKAIDRLQSRGLNFKGLFIGKGDKSYTENIKKCKGCQIIDFKPVSNLPDFYWAADIGVWPSQESMSQLDALACGLPLVLSNKIEVSERIDGNGFLYIDGNPEDLALKLLKLQNNKKRIELGIYGSKKIERDYSWSNIARIRTQYYMNEIQ